MNDVESDESWKEYQESKEYDKQDHVVVDEKALNLQVVEKVCVKRNRGLKRDILKFIENAPNVSPEVVYSALKDNQYGGSKPVSLGCVMSTMSQLKKKAGSWKLDLNTRNEDGSVKEPKEQ
jgi:hypothetical protein